LIKKGWWGNSPQIKNITNKKIEKEMKKEREG